MMETTSAAPPVKPIDSVMMAGIRPQLFTIHLKNLRTEETSARTTPVSEREKVSVLALLWLAFVVPSRATMTPCCAAAGGYCPCGYRTCEWENHQSSLDDGWLCVAPSYGCDGKPSNGEVYCQSGRFQSEFQCVGNEYNYDSDCCQWSGSECHSGQEDRECPFGQAPTDDPHYTPFTSLRDAIRRSDPESDPRSVVGPTALVDSSEDPSCAWSDEMDKHEAEEMVGHVLVFFSPVFILTVCFNRCYDPV